MTQLRDSRRDLQSLLSDFRALLGQVKDAALKQKLDGLCDRLDDIARPDNTLPGEETDPGDPTQLPSGPGTTKPTPVKGT